MKFKIFIFFVSYILSGCSDNAINNNTLSNNVGAMDTKNTIVWFNGDALSLNPDTANELGLKNGYRIKSEKEFWDILGHNVSMGINKIETEKEVETK